MFTYLILIFAASKHFGFISKKTTECLKFKDRNQQNSQFYKIKHPVIEPVKLTSSSAVFYDNENNVIIKRIVKKPNSARKEDIYCKIFKHPNILRTYDVFHTNILREDKNVCYIVSEYLNKPVTIKSVNGREDVIRNICRDVLHGLRYMHNMNYAHLDLKTGNIMGHTDEKGKTVYKLIDFGFVRKIFGNKVLDLGGRYYGTYPFSPPEVYFDGLYSKKCDVWCLGCIAYFLVSGYDKFYDGSERDYDIYEMFLRGELDIELKGVSREMKRFVEQCLTVNYEDRPSVNELLKDDFITGVSKY